MGKIYVIKEPTLVKPKIVQPLMQPTVEQAEKLADDGVNVEGGEKSQAQTKIDGIQMPLLRFNDITLQWAQVRSFKMYIDFMPYCELVIADIGEIMSTLGSTDTENKLYVQIIPSFDNGYKKINLTFHVTDVYASSGTIHISGMYWAEGLLNYQFHSFGEVTTFELVEKIADQLGLGVASDIDNTTDKRWIYSPGISYIDLLKKEVNFASYNEQPVAIWIDYYDCINIVNYYDCYNNNRTVDEIYVTSVRTDVDTYTKDPETAKIPAKITNDTRVPATQLFAQRYKSITSSNDSVKGTDRIIQYYSIEDMDTRDFLVQDGSKSNDIFCKYEYGGEFVGDYDYVKQKLLNDKFRDIVDANQIEIKLASPVFGLYKGNRVDVEWYETDGEKTDIMDANNDNLETNRNFEEKNEDQYNGQEATDNTVKHVLNKSISGQYMILSCDYDYNNKGGFQNVLRLGRSNYEKHNYIFDNNTNNSI